MSSVLKAAGLIGLLALISKVIGLLREIIINNYYGTSYIRDAYVYASAFPLAFALIMLAGLNGPFHSSVVTVISKYKAQGRIDDTKTTITTITIISTIIMTIITFLSIKFAPEVIAWTTSPDLPIKTRDLAIEQLMIMSPIFIVSGLIGISYGILNIEKVYLAPSLSPVMASISIIVALLIASPENGAVALAWGTLIGATLQLVLQIISMLPTIKNYFNFKFDIKHSGVRDIFRTLLPATLSSTIGQINLIITGYFASGMEEGAISAIYSSNLIYQLPLGIMLTALLVPMLPVLSQSFIKNDNKIEFKKNINRAVRSLIFLSIPLSAILICSGQLFTKMLFERGAFTEHSTLITYQCLITTAIGMVFYAIRDLLVRVFYAMDNAATPFYTTIFSILSITFFCWLFTHYFHLQADGIALAVSFVTTLNMGILGYTLYRKIGNWVEIETVKQFVKISITTIPVVIFCLFFNYMVDYKYNWFIFGIYTVLMSFLGIACIGFLRYLKDQEIIDITDSIMKKLKLKR